MQNMIGHNLPPISPRVPGTKERSEEVPTAIIYRPSRSVMQSGRARQRHWVLEFEPTCPPEIEPLMGWTSSADPYRQIRLTFPDKDSAIQFAQSQDWDFIVREDTVVNGDQGRHPH